MSMKLKVGIKLQDRIIKLEQGFNKVNSEFHLTIWREKEQTVWSQLWVLAQTLNP